MDDAIELVVDVEFLAFLPTFTDEEDANLERKILEEGCRDAVIVWGNILVDGHRRHKICRRWDIPFRVEKMTFADRDAVKKWMSETQLARRNLTDLQRAFYIGEQYILEKKDSGYQPPVDEEVVENSENETQEEVSPSNTSSGKTREKVAKRNKVSASKVAKDAKFAEAVNAHEAKAPGSMKKILAGEAGSMKKVIATAPVRCPLCTRKGLFRDDCSECIELKKPVKNGKPKKRPDSLPPIVKVHPHDELRALTIKLSGMFTKAMKDGTEEGKRLHSYLSLCTLVEHTSSEDPAKHNQPVFLPLKGITKMIDLAGQTGKPLSDDKVREAWKTASGYTPPLHARRRAFKAGTKKARK